MATFTPLVKNRLSWIAPVVPVSDVKYYLNIGGGYNLLIGSGHKLVIQLGGRQDRVWSNKSKYS